MSEESFNLLEKLSNKQLISDIYNLTLRVHLISNSRDSSRTVRREHSCLKNSLVLN